MSSSTESTSHGGEIGTLSMIVHSSQIPKKSGKIPLTPVPQYYEPGKNYTSMTIGDDVPTPKFVTLIWDYKTNPINPLTWRILASPRLYIEFIVLETMEQHSRYTYGYNNFNDFLLYYFYLQITIVSTE